MIGNIIWSFKFLKFEVCYAFTFNYYMLFALLGFKILFIYSWKTQREGRDISRRRSRGLTGNLMWDLFLELWDHALSQRQTLNCWATQESPIYTLLRKVWSRNVLVQVWNWIMIRIPLPSPNYSPFPPREDTKPRTFHRCQSGDHRKWVSTSLSRPSRPSAGLFYSA